MNSSLIHCPQIREEVLRDRRYPVHTIADQLLPYLQVLVGQFHPDQIILFGSHAYGEPTSDSDVGEPTSDSDVDLLIVKSIQEGRVKDKVAIRRAWWSLLVGRFSLSFDLQLVTPEEFAAICPQVRGYYSEILRKGLRVA